MYNNQGVVLVSERVKVTCDVAVGGMAKWWLTRACSQSTPGCRICVKCLEVAEPNYLELRCWLAGRYTASVIEKVKLTSEMVVEVSEYVKSGGPAERSAYSAK